jgi:ribosomal protein S18 acetylase RimI-like enzyme
MSQPFKIEPAVFPRDKQEIIRLFTAYTRALDLDLTFQDYETEISSLPGKYAPGRGGCLLVARPDNVNDDDNKLLGCVAYRRLPLHPHDDGERFCEMKRLYLAPEARGSGIGTKLVEAIIQHAKSTRLYRGMRLDTLPSTYMASARALYKRYGFVEIAAYYQTPLEGTIFMGLEF